MERGRVNKNCIQQKGKEVSMLRLSRLKANCLTAILIFIFVVGSSIQARAVEIKAYVYPGKAPDCKGNGICRIELSNRIGHKVLTGMTAMIMSADFNLEGNQITIVFKEPLDPRLMNENGRYVVSISKGYDPLAIYKDESGNQIVDQISLNRKNEILAIAGAMLLEIVPGQYEIINNRLTMGIRKI